MQQSRTGVALLFPANKIRGLLHQEGLFLAISRKDDSTKFGIPGGKVELNESEIEAVQRETLEEIGLIGYYNEFQTIHSGKCVGYWVSTYLWVGDDISLETLIAEEGTELKWFTVEELCKPDISPFSEYNKKVFKAYIEWLKHAALH